MNIVLCTDENYAMPCGVCITSIFENNKEIECNVYVLTQSLEQSTISRFEQLSKKYGQKIDIIKIDSSILKGLKVSDRFREAIYYRFLIPDILDADKALYLDCDIIVNQNLMELWNIDISEYACAVVEDQAGDDIRLHNRIEMYSTYFNSGVLLMNLNYWRFNNLKELLIDYIYHNPERCLYPDQDALNVILENKVVFLDYKYNFQDLMRSPVEMLFLHRCKWPKIHKCLNTIPDIIHYTAFIKPWHIECELNYKDFFLSYKEMSPWSAEKLIRKFSLPFRIKRFCIKIYNFFEKYYLLMNNR